jgi:hypothetical protein
VRASEGRGDPRLSINDSDSSEPPVRALPCLIPVSRTKEHPRDRGRERHPGAGPASALGVGFDLGQERLEPVGEYVVIVAGDHVACRLYVDGLGVRDELDHVG